MTEQIGVEGIVKTCEELSDRDRERLHVLLTEHSYIQNTIFHHKTTLQTILNFIILLIAAEIALFTQLAGKPLGAEYTNTLLLLPIPFTLLAIYHSAYTIRIHKLAAYLDNDLRGRIENIAGSELLRQRSFQGTRHILDLPRANLDGKMTYLALLGLKVLPQVVPLAVCLSLGVGSLAWWQVLWLVVDATLVIVSGVGQHD